VYTTGVDQKVSQFAFVNTGPRAVGGLGRWVHACSRRMHSHDVRALVTWPPHQPLTPPASSLASKISNSVSSFVISGGLDMAVCVCPCIPPAVSGRVKNLNGPGDPGSFEEAYYRRMPYGLGTNSVLQVSPASRSLLCRNDDKLTLYRLSDLPTTWHSENHQFEDGNGWVRVAEMQLQSMTNLTSSAVSNDGEWICASDYYEAKLFHLNYGVCESFQAVPRRSSLNSRESRNAPSNASNHLAIVSFRRCQVRPIQRVRVQWSSPPIRTGSS
jgi:U3 small nucleolar RNA-associated protein 4